MTVGGRAALAASLAAAALAHSPQAAAAPAWQAHGARSSGAVGMATWDFAFAVVSGGGAGGHEFVHRNLLLGDTALVDLRNSGTVPVRLSGTMTLTTVLGGSVSISTCPTVSVSLSCATGTQAVASLTVLGSTVVPVAYAAGVELAPGGAVRLKVELRGAVGNQVRMTAVPARRPPAERTWS